jgi:hypothetical protein
MNRSEIRMQNAVQHGIETAREFARQLYLEQRQQKLLDAQKNNQPIPPIDTDKSKEKNYENS